MDDDDDGEAEGEAAAVSIGCFGGPAGASDTLPLAESAELPGLGGPGARVTSGDAASPRTQSAAAECMDTDAGTGPWPATLSRRSLFVIVA